MNETFITILEDIYTGATARVLMDNQLSLRRNTNTGGVRQGDPISQLEEKGIDIHDQKNNKQTNK